MQFEFATARRIVFGEGTAAATAPDAARSLGRRPLVVTGRNSERARWLTSQLEACEVFAAEGEPTVELAREGARRARESARDVVIGFGGGSAIDAAKAIAALAPNSGEPLDYLEVVGRGGALEHAPLPVIAIPTTAGTGSEVTRNAVLQSTADRVKASLRSPAMLPRVAIIDPELTRDLPPLLTAATGLDALTQLVEPYTSVRANPLTDALCAAGIALVARSLRRAVEAPDAEARRDMALASLYGGLALANAGLGVVHGFAAPLGAMWSAPHGALCAAVLPYGVAANLRALRARQPESPLLGKYATVARLLTGRADAHAENAVEWLAALCAQLAIPRLGGYGITAADVPAVVAKAARASSTKGNAVVLSEEELEAVLRAAL